MTGLPDLADSSSAYSEFEHGDVLAKTWFCIANLAQLPGTGRVHPVDIPGLPPATTGCPDTQAESQPGAL